MAGLGAAGCLGFHQLYRSLEPVGGRYQYPKRISSQWQATRTPVGRFLLDVRSLAASRFRRLAGGSLSCFLDSRRRLLPMVGRDGVYGTGVDVRLALRHAADARVGRIGGVSMLFAHPGDRFSGESSRPHQRVDRRRHQERTGSRLADWRPGDCTFRLARAVRCTGFRQSVVARSVAALDAARESVLHAGGSVAGAQHAPDFHPSLRSLQRAGTFLLELLLVFSGDLAAALPGNGASFFENENGDTRVMRIPHGGRIECDIGMGIGPLDLPRRRAHARAQDLYRARAGAFHHHSARRAGAR